MMTQSTLLACFLLSATSSAARSLDDREEEGFGAVIAPPVLPAAATATPFYLALAALAVAFRPSGGGGSGFHPTQELSLSVLALIGPGLFHPLLGLTNTQLGYGIRLGMGFRLF